MADKSVKKGGVLISGIQIIMKLSIKIERKGILIILLN
jgi:hypothetical protein